MEETIPQRYFIVFLRHGESVGNAEERFQGQADYPLTEAGKAQARALGERWKAEKVHFDLCIASPLRRARETAELVAGPLGTPVETAPEWMEINNGQLAGLTEEEATASVPRPPFMTLYTRYGGTGESRWELYLRAGRALQRLIERPYGRYLVVSHGGLLNMIMYAVLGVPPQGYSRGPRFMFGNAGFAAFTYEPAGHTWRLQSFDNSIHGKSDPWNS